MAIRVVELAPSHWPALEALFGPAGACGGCWCMWWRVPRGGALWDRVKGAPNKAAFRALVHAGKARGVLAFEHAPGAAPRAVGWCAFGPREEFPRTERVKAYQRDDAGAGTWSVNCFFIAREARGQGVARALLAGAIRACRRRGARTIEGYPVTATQDGRRVAPTFAWTGPLGIFADQGFEVVQATVPLRPLVQLRLSRTAVKDPARSGTRDRSRGPAGTPRRARTSSR